MKAVAKGVVSILLLPLVLGAQVVLADNGSSNIEIPPTMQDAGSMGKEQAVKHRSEMTKEEWKQYKADMKAEKKMMKKKLKAEKKAERLKLKAEKKARREMSKAEKKAEREKLKADKKAKREMSKAEKKARREQLKAEKKAERDRRREARKRKNALNQQDPMNRRPLDEKFEDF